MSLLKAPGLKLAQQDAYHRHGTKRTCCAAVKPHSKYFWLLRCDDNKLLNQFGISRLSEDWGSSSLLCAVYVLFVSTILNSFFIPVVWENSNMVLLSRGKNTVTLI